LSTIGQSDPFNPKKETTMPTKQRNIHIIYEPLKAEFDTIEKHLSVVIEEVKRVASEFGDMPLPVPYLDEPDTGENNAHRVLHSALLKLDKTKHEITLDDWQRYAARYDDFVATYGGHTARRTGQKLINFKDEMSAALDSIGDHIRANGIDKVFPKSFFGDNPSPRALAAVAVIHAAEWLAKKKAGQVQENDLTRK
jgi:hypothetical protein